MVPLNQINPGTGIIIIFKSKIVVGNCFLGEQGDRWVSCFCSKSFKRYATVSLSDRHTYT